jgi:energy-coupling factor transporter ATP-binding protein EcfA2
MNLHDSIITQVVINGLHGDRNIISNFQSTAKILVDENGSGKTTFLNILVGLLQGKWHIVNRYDFDEVRIYFKNDEQMIFNRSEFEREFDYLDLDDPLIADILTRIPDEMIQELFLSIGRYSYSELLSHGILEIISQETEIPSRVIYDRILRDPSLRRIMRNYAAHQKSLFDGIDEEKRSELKRKFKELRKLFPYQVLYFPTYRLVEENLHYLGYERRIRKRGEQLIQFGMRDVRKQWDSITEDIRNSALQWFSRINGRMLDELTEGIRPDSIDYRTIEQPEALEIVLARSGENIAPASRTRILNLVKSQEIKGHEYAPLAYFLSNLIKIYEQQQAIDDAIKNFVKVANSYLTDKEIFYDEAEMSIQVINMRSHKRMPLDKLSSGEKQIVSIFSRLYLNFNNSEPYAIFFDEPELSLSMEWQKNLLEDIAEADQCVFLLAATHSPFIFENKLAQYADVLTTQFLGGDNE